MNFFKGLWKLSLTQRKAKRQLKHLIRENFDFTEEKYIHLEMEIISNLRFVKESSIEDVILIMKSLQLQLNRSLLLIIFVMSEIIVYSTKTFPAIIQNIFCRNDFNEPSIESFLYELLVVALDYQYYKFINIILDLHVLNKSKFNELLQNPSMKNLGIDKFYQVKFKHKSQEIIANIIRKDLLEEFISEVTEKDNGQISELHKGKAKTFTYCEYAAIYNANNIFKYLWDRDSSLISLKRIIESNNTEIMKLALPKLNTETIEILMKTAIKSHNYYFIKRNMSKLPNNYSPEIEEMCVESLNLVYLMCGEINVTNSSTSEKFISKQVSKCESYFAKKAKLIRNKCSSVILFEEKVHRFETKETETGYKDVAVSFNSNISDVIECLEKQIKKLQAVIKNSPSSNKKVDPKDFVLATLSEGLIFSKSYMFLLKCRISPPSKKTFFRVQKSLQKSIIDFTQSSLLQERFLLTEEFSYDCSWITRRNSKAGFGAFLSTKNRIFDYDIAIKGENYSGTSQHMEVEIFKKLAARWSTNSHLKFIIKDVDVHINSALESLNWKLIEFLDPNHAFGVIKRKIIAYSKLYKTTFKGIKTHLIRYVKILLHDENQTTEQRLFFWNNIIRHLKDDHHKCRHTVIVVNWQCNGYSSHEEIIQELIDSCQEIVKKVNPKFSTQASESLHSVKAKIIPKIYSFSKSIHCRLALSVLQWKQPYTYSREFFRKYQNVQYFFSLEGGQKLAKIPKYYCQELFLVSFSIKNAM
ncbi:hypothetical protein TRFO_08182 [Tritrichomonas foetus]|uniref:Uncharacterized protein n=1 Tax=Tritrichomonas foetus TaxID=1144522 RepID=A0A1J4JN68_9EUKA|nr:hypothetical protein TRFO_08182 [Tritrichomonas foetus]|eukprot:OHS99879.1 hypothetical protein TRFO_08182 [Tritrichomonas foetus]